MDVILNPPLPIAIEEFYKTLLSVSGVLFGIAFAAMLFVLQSGFSSFKFSRRMFLELYLHFGRQLLYSLAYITASPFLVLFFPNSAVAVSWLYGLYFIFFLNATLDYAKEEGYIITIHSKKYVPSHYGRRRAYFRYIANRGVLKKHFVFATSYSSYNVSIHYIFNQHWRSVSYKGGSFLQLSSTTTIYSL